MSHTCNSIGRIDEIVALFLTEAEHARNHSELISLFESEAPPELKRISLAVTWTRGPHPLLLMPAREWCELFDQAGFLVHVLRREDQRDCCTNR